MTALIRPRVVAACVVLLGAATGSPAQTLPDIAGLSESSTLDAGQVQQVEAWVGAAMQIVRSGEPDGMVLVRSQAAAECAGSSTAAFRDALAEALIRQGAALLTGGTPEQSQTMISMLGQTRSTRAVGALSGALSHKDPGTRFLAARGLERLQGDFGEDTVATIQQIEESLLKEAVPAVGVRLCEALRVPAQTGRAAQALATFITQRTGQFRRSGAGDMAPLRSAVSVLERLGASQLPANNRPQVAAAVADLLDFSVRTYLSDQELDNVTKDNLERIIDQAEPVLRQLITASTATDNLPSVSAKMRAGGAEVAANMESELNRWLGSGTTPGVLSAAPWSLPIGGGFASADQS